ncbi:hypothetical protein EGR_08685 [Echinococcus granulosus]|uniref:Uncharacterized protein n=1 Tax=Echinococcus granulosus TaxID=6210 RepID=W6U5N3_ECHGR|nr:hypothetical protein EGR_08685 [Echinococcus granulosus]EUB56463.1 hypothetical protein EGR_08685 [Echinococcus granulosus]
MSDTLEKHFLSVNSNMKIRTTLPRGCCSQESEQFEVRFIPVNFNPRFNSTNLSFQLACLSTPNLLAIATFNLSWRLSGSGEISAHNNGTSKGAIYSTHLQKQPSEMCYEDLQKPRIPSEASFLKKKINNRNTFHFSGIPPHAVVNINRNNAHPGIIFGGLSSQKISRSLNMMRLLNRCKNLTCSENCNNLFKKISYSLPNVFPNQVCVTLTCQQPQYCKCDTCRQTCSTPKKPSGGSSNTCPQQQCPPLKKLPLLCYHTTIITQISPLNSYFLFVKTPKHDWHPFFVCKEKESTRAIKSFCLFFIHEFSRIPVHACVKTICSIHIANSTCDLLRNQPAEDLMTASRSRAHQSKTINVSEWIGCQVSYPHDEETSCKNVGIFERVFDHRNLITAPRLQWNCPIPKPVNLSGWPFNPRPRCG